MLRELTTKCLGTSFPIKLEISYCVQDFKTDKHNTGNIIEILWNTGQKLDKRVGISGISEIKFL